eukprot:TRINITY_DN1299_c0_g2_i2.p1 TRINITY_DN1299_c0_g2~~TRINITY_DN1299_c0_g2_i2.p1  ORF type:complete len:142 (+),score=6.45 TRINITY_DN1299_c0_g2_i2:1645-2070(+)
MIKSYISSGKRTLTKSEEIETEIANQFTLLYSTFNGSTSNLPLIKPISERAKSIIGARITHSEICMSIKQLKPRSAPGPNYFKHASINLIPHRLHHYCSLPYRRYFHPHYKWMNSQSQSPPSSPKKSKTYPVLIISDRFPL